MRRKLTFTLVSLVLAALACNLTETVPPSPTATATTAAFTTATVTPSPTITSLPASATPPPDPVLPPTTAPVSTAAPTRIRFASGATSATLDNQPISAGGTRRFVLEAGAGQRMGVGITGIRPEDFDRFSLAVTGAADGVVLVDGLPGTLTWSGVLPGSQDYIIDVRYHGTAATTFYLAVDIPRRITFQAGATSASIPGGTGGPGAAAYVLAAQAGQVMWVRVATADPDAWLSVVDPNGSPLLRGQWRQTHFVGTLPTSGDYWLAVGSEATASYTLYVTIGQRIRFQAGATEALLAGEIVDGAEDVYVLEAAADQVMSVYLRSAEENTWLQITGLDNTPLVPAEPRRSIWTGRLPGTQDYAITITNDGRDTPYTLQVIIPQRVRFDPGATSTRIEGRLVGDFSTAYVLEAGAGQTMTITLESPGGDVMLSIVGADGIPLHRYESGTTTWSNILPTTQDYLVTAVNTGLTFSDTFTLTISVTG